MNIHILPVGPFEVNCAVVWNNQQQALIIDPGADAEQITAVLNSNGLTVSAYLLTHGHTDHLGELATLHAARPAPVYIHTEDFLWAFGPQNQIPPYYAVPKKPAAEWIHPTSSTRGTPPGFNFQIIETPGHTRGGVCYYFESEGVLFSGDTLFKGTCGRTDLPGSDSRVLAQSLKKLTALPDEVTIYPGHNESTTIGYEKRTNFFLK